MVKTKILQLFEFQILNAVASLEEKATAAEITRQIQKFLQREVALAQVYVALKRLTTKGYLEQHIIGPRPVRGGKKQFYYVIQEEGLDAVIKTKEHFRSSFP